MLDLFESSWKDLWGEAAAAEPVGAVFTRLEIVRLILDLAGYNPKHKDLRSVRVLEPSCGSGAFLTEVTRRLAQSLTRSSARTRWNDKVLDSLVRACDISVQSVDSARKNIEAILEEAGCAARRASDLAGSWTVHCDFLLQNWDSRFDLVVGNPPYVRIEDLPRRVLERYRHVFATTRDRADLYVAFIEKGLSLLSDRGVLGFICANRFTKNQYGRALRQLIVREFRVRHYLNLEHTQPFEQEVSAYPAIVVIDRGRGRPTHAATLSDLQPATLSQVLTEAKRPRSGELLSVFPEWYPRGGPWLTTSGSEQDWLDALASHLPPLEQSADDVRVGIGCATGADRVFVLDARRNDVEESRQLPLVLAGDIGNHGLTWSGHYLLNPFEDGEEGRLVRPATYPGLTAYFESRRADLVRRHVARRQPHSWYRTIDRIWPELLSQPKLVIPDIQGETTIGFDEGRFYPHHNVYFVTSAAWSLPALKSILRSSLVRRQVAAFSVQMRGGSLRFQAQTLRRLRVPPLRLLPSRLLSELEHNSESADLDVLDGLAAEAFGIIDRRLVPAS